MGLDRSLKVEGSLRSSASEVKSDSTQGITCGIDGGKESGRFLSSRTCHCEYRRLHTTGPCEC